MFTQHTVILRQKVLEKHSVIKLLCCPTVKVLTPNWTTATGFHRDRPHMLGDEQHFNKQGASKVRLLPKVNTPMA